MEGVNFNAYNPQPFNNMVPTNKIKANNDLLKAILVTGIAVAIGLILYQLILEYSEDEKLTK